MNLNINIGPYYHVENSRHVAIADASKSSPLPVAKSNSSYWWNHQYVGLTAVLLLLLAMQMGWYPRVLEGLDLLKAAVDWF